MRLFSESVRVIVFPPSPLCFCSAPRNATPFENFSARKRRPLYSPRFVIREMRLLSIRSRSTMRCVMLVPFRDPFI